MFHRDIKNELLLGAAEYPVITLTGPRQSGKSTILKATFPDYTYISLEDSDMREKATTDPRGFLKEYPRHIILDEVQRVPTILSYIQTHIDSLDEEGVFCVSGSKNLSLMAQVDQSLAGRTSVLRLLPLSHSEMRRNGILPQSTDGEMFRGAYPRVYNKHLSPWRYYQNYIDTYVERDVRQLQRINDLDRFIRFIGLCAGRVGQILNLTSLANDCGISVSTASEWISVLEASYIIYLLKPDYRNYSKRLIKSPKLYFYDTGLVCRLLEISSERQLNNHYLRGSLFENLVISEFLKRSFNIGGRAALSYWRESNGVEIDLIVSAGEKQTAYEIKSSLTFSWSFFDNLRKWAKYSGESAESCNVIYDGDSDFPSSDGNIIAWRTF